MPKFAVKAHRVAYLITEACTKDKSCLAVCPVDCIYDIGPRLHIHLDECIECGLCLPECPVEAIIIGGGNDEPDIAVPARLL